MERQIFHRLYPGHIHAPRTPKTQCTRMATIRSINISMWNFNAMRLEFDSKLNKTGQIKAENRQGNNKTTRWLGQNEINKKIFLFFFRRRRKFKRKIICRSVGV